MVNAVAAFFPALWYLNMEIRNEYLGDLDADLINHGFVDHIFFNPPVYGTTALAMDRADAEVYAERQSQE